MIRNKFILIPMNNQNRRIVFGDVSDWIRFRDAVLMLLNGSAYQLRFWRVRCVMHQSVWKAMRIHLKKIRGTEVINNGLYPTGHLQIFTYLKFSYISCCSEHGNQVSTRR